MQTLLGRLLQVLSREILRKDLAIVVPDRPSEGHDDEPWLRRHRGERLPAFPERCPKLILRVSVESILEAGAGLGLPYRRCNSLLEIRIRSDGG